MSNVCMVKTIEERELLVLTEDSLVIVLDPLDIYFYNNNNKSFIKTDIDLFLNNNKDNTNLEEISEDESLKDDYYKLLAEERLNKIIMFNQSLRVYNKLPWYKKIFIKEVEIKCQYENGYNCCCGKH